MLSIMRPLATLEEVVGMITESLIQLTEAARQTVDSLRQSNAAIDDLNQVAISLKTGVSKFALQPA